MSCAHHWIIDPLSEARAQGDGTTRIGGSCASCGERREDFDPTGELPGNRRFAVTAHDVGRCGSCGRNLRSSVHVERCLGGSAETYALFTQQ